MRLIHISDFHLGFRQYHRLTPSGINQREADVAATFRTAVDRIIALRPEIVVIAGDVFHSVRPTNPALLHAFQQLSRLRLALPDTLIAMIAGNHDTPRVSENVCILRLFPQLGVHVVDGTPQRLSFPERELSILAVPYLRGAPPEMRPDPTVRNNILLYHGELEGLHPHWAVDRTPMPLATELLHAPSWNYVALGHYHVFRQIAPNAFYSGSVEYTSLNMWGEMAEERQAKVPGKGFIEFDLETEAYTFHPIASPRRFVDLPVIVARGMSAADLDRRLQEVVEDSREPIDDAIVRLVVRDVPRHIVRELDQPALRVLRRRALFFHLDIRRPEAERTHASGAPGRRPSLVEIVRDTLQRRPLESDVDRDALVALGLRYLNDADSVVAGLAEQDGTPS